MRKYFYIAIITAFFYFGVSIHAKDQAIKIRVTNWPPQYYQDKNNHWTGVDVELARALVSRAGFTPVFESLPWARGIEYLKTGKIQMILGFGIKEERKEYALWLGPSRSISVGLFVKKGNESLPIKSLDDMLTIAKKLNKNFGHQNQAFFSVEFNHRLKTDPEFAEFFEIASPVYINVRKTLSGRILGFFEVKDILMHRIKNDAEYKELIAHPFILDKRPTYFGISKKGVSVKTLSKLYETYENVIKDGTFQRIRDQWDFK